jgi:hypothetical protein
MFPSLVSSKLLNFFQPLFMNFCNKPECLLDWAGIACQRQTLKLIAKINKFRKKFYNIGPRCQSY